MKIIAVLLLSLLLLTGCGRTEPETTQADNKTQTDSKMQTVLAEQITEADAKRIALEHAGLTEGAVKNLRVEYDWEDRQYEVEFTAKRVEYDYEIDAVDGRIWKAEKESVYD